MHSTQSKRVKLFSISNDVFIDDELLTSLDMVNLLINSIFNYKIDLIASKTLNFLLYFLFTVLFVIFIVLIFLFGVAKFMTIIFSTVK